VQLDIEEIWSQTLWHATGHRLRGYSGTRPLWFRPYLRDITMVLLTLITSCY